MQINLPYRFRPRDYQRDLLYAFFHEKKRHAFYLCHRRAGKDKTCVNILVAAACDRVGTYLYLFPQLNQAKRVIWKGIDGDGMRFLDHIPRELIRKKNGTDMSVELINGSIIQLGGSNHFDALMGTNPVGIIYSEFPMHTPLARQYLSPILAENRGWEIMQGTPRGKNHAYKLFMNVAQDPDWFVRKLTVDDTFREDGTPVISPVQIEEERRNGMSEEMIRQEFYCDFNVGTVGAYFTNEMDHLEMNGRICNFEIHKNLPVFTVWDIGVHDATSISFFQQQGDDINMIYYFQATDKGVDFFARKIEEIRQDFGWKYRNHFAPHDIKVREWGSSARSRVALAADQGIHFLRIPRLDKEDQISALRALMPYLRIHATNCAFLIDALREYRREYDEENRVFKQTPLHNWACHAVDTMLGLGVVWRNQFAHPEFNQVKRYQSSF